MTRYMLDTRTVSHLLRSHPTVTARVLKVPMESLCISADGRVEDRGLDGFYGVRSVGPCCRFVDYAACWCMNKSDQITDNMYSVIQGFFKEWYENSPH